MVGPQDTYEAGPNGNEVLGPNPGTNILTTNHIYIYTFARWLLRVSDFSPIRGSAGANCWFDAGHSDSMDPMTFRRSARRVFGGHGRGFREGLGWLNVYFFGGRGLGMFGACLFGGGG